MNLAVDLLWSREICCSFVSLSFNTDGLSLSFWYVVVDTRSVFFLGGGWRFCLFATYVVMDRLRKW
ncbi:hypothetical protein MtrunA17_Chr2g0324451 [Medicago truncatula]|uniref:Transmembrane protein n=1 Tax=Medicago truncatula TaxID=3880 RepID=A0A396JH88_MEDTR|nr:hypothetical protein MtrunA17_Chr2g0324451 [Medicago truncatula]